MKKSLINASAILSISVGIATEASADPCVGFADIGTGINVAEVGGKLPFITNKVYVADGVADCTPSHPISLGANVKATLIDVVGVDATGGIELGAGAVLTYFTSSDKSKGKISGPATGNIATFAITGEEYTLVTGGDNTEKFQITIKSPTDAFVLKGPATVESLLNVGAGLEVELDTIANIPAKITATGKIKSDELVTTITGK